MGSFLDKFKFMKKPFRAPRPAPAFGAGTVAAEGAPMIELAGSATGESYRVLIRPVVSEKAAHLADQNQYCFEVAIAASKQAVAEAVTHVYGITPSSVNVITVKGKRVNFRRTAGAQKNWKKAVVTLPPGKRIKLFEGV